MTKRAPFAGIFFLEPGSKSFENKFLHQTNASRDGCGIRLPRPKPRDKTPQHRPHFDGGEMQKCPRALRRSAHVKEPQVAEINPVHTTTVI